MTETPCSLNVFAVPPVERISTPVCAKPFANETTPVLSETLTIALLIFPISSPPNTKFEYRNPKQISHGQLSTPACGRQARTMKIPLDPPFTKGDNYPSLWQREVWRDLKKLFSKEMLLRINDKARREIER